MRQHFQSSCGHPSYPRNTTGYDRTSLSRRYLHWPGSQPGWDFAACTLLIRSPKQQDHCQLMQPSKTGLLEGSAPEDGSPGLFTKVPAKAHCIWSRGALCIGFADGSPQLSITDQGDAVIPGCGCSYGFTNVPLTCAHSNGLHELVPPGMCPYNQRQVCLPNQLVHGALLWE